MRRQIVLRMRAVLTGLLVAAVLSGWGHPGPGADGPQRRDVAEAVAALAGGAGGRAARLPDDFAAGPDRRVYGCSSPFGGTRYRFDAACRHHDLGYDLLRHAAAHGRPLGPWARQAIDARFSRETLGRCATWGCRAVGAGYVAAVELNSWRQGFGVPSREGLADVAPAGATGIVTALLLGAFPVRPSRGRRRPAPRVTVPAAASAAALALAAQPTMLPHPWWLQSAAGAALATLAFAAATALRRLLAGSRSGTTAVPAAAVAVGLALALSWAAAAGPHPLVWLLGTTALAAAGCAVVVAGARSVPGVLRRAATLQSRPPIRRPAALALTTALVAGCSVGPGSAPARAETPGRGTVTSTTSGLRVAVREDDAATARARARLAGDALERSGGLDGDVVLVVVPTGSGWVNEAAPAALARLCGGRVATVSVQYAAAPSWLVHLRGGDGVQESVRATVGELARRIARRPATDRPRLLVYGESLGAWGGLAAYPGRSGLPEGADGAVWAGVPAGVAVPDGDPRVRVVVHDDDPVPAWSPAMLVVPSPAWPHTWLPLASFWQVSVDVLGARLGPDGRGHRYGPELVGAWRSVVGDCRPRTTSGSAGVDGVAGAAQGVDGGLQRARVDEHVVGVERRDDEDRDTDVGERAGQRGHDADHREVERGRPPRGRASRARPGRRRPARRPRSTRRTARNRSGSR